MVTKITNEQKYKALFKKAWDELAMRQIFNDVQLIHYGEIGNTFTSLEDYFTKLGTLMTIGDNEIYPNVYKIYELNSEGNLEEVELNSPKAGLEVVQNWEFVFLPLEESRFEINADTRDIIIPNDFKKLVSVAGDHFAETLIFSIDRFFDSTDLLTKEIGVQWVDENGINKLTNLTKIKYYDANEQKIIFGWPLNDMITKNDRVINFSIRFFSKIDEVLNYSFNTKIHQIVIAPALKADLSDGVQVEQVSDSFLSIIEDSPSTEAPPATIPYFSAPGTDLETEAVLDEDNKYTLTVRAVKNGSGTIAYNRWFYKNQQGEISDLGNGKFLFEEVTPTIDDLKKNVNEEYWILNDSNPLPTYRIWTYNENMEEDDIPTLYQRFHTYTVEKSAENSILGDYWTSAQNKTSNNISEKVYTNTCNFSGVGTLAYTKDLQKNMFLEADGNTTLSVEIESTNEATSLKYLWKCDENSNKMNNITKEEIDDNEHVVQTPGWYQVKTIASRNGDEQFIDSEVCRVVNKPIVSFKKPTYEEIIIEEGQQQILTAEINPVGEPSLLYSDGIKYDWYVVEPDNDDEIQLTESNYNIYNVESKEDNKLTVEHPGRWSIYGYKCKAINTLADKTASAEKLFTVTFKQPE